MQHNIPKHPRQPASPWSVPIACHRQPERSWKVALSGACRWSRRPWYFRGCLAGREWGEVIWQYSLEGRVNDFQNGMKESKFEYLNFDGAHSYKGPASYFPGEFGVEIIPCSGTNLLDGRVSRELHASNENLGNLEWPHCVCNNIFQAEVNDRRSIDPESKTLLRWIPGRWPEVWRSKKVVFCKRSMGGGREFSSENHGEAVIIAGTQAMRTWTTLCSTRATRWGPYHWDGLWTNEKWEQTHEVDGGWYREISQL